MCRTIRPSILHLIHRFTVDGIELYGFNGDLQVVASQDFVAVRSMDQRDTTGRAHYWVTPHDDLKIVTLK